MGLDEALFGAFFRATRSLFRGARAREEERHGAPLDAVRDRVRILASAIAGTQLRVETAEGVGGVTHDAIRLPAMLCLGGSVEIATEAWIVRTIQSAWLHKLGFARPAAAELGWERTLATALAIGGIRAPAEDDLPALASLRRRPELATLRARGPLPDAAGERLAEELVRAALTGAAPPSPITAWPLSPRELDDAFRSARAAITAKGPVRELAPVPLWGELLPWTAARAAPTKVRKGQKTSLPKGTERRAKPRDSVERIEERENPLAENPLVHSFEKVHTAEQYQGGTKRMDGADELDAHADALEELDLRQVIRTSQGAGSVYRADGLLEDFAGEVDEEPDGSGFAYDEWDESRRAYREGWCRVHVERPSSRSTLSALGALRARHRRTIETLRHRFASIDAARRARLRQLDGPDVDLDALVQRHADLRAGTTGVDRLYVSRRPHARDVAMLLLLDASMSTDAWVDDRRVLDVERDAVLLLGEAVRGLWSDIAVAAFASHTRRDCRFFALKGFRESWEDGAARLLALEPDGYTRLGPALRHGTAMLRKSCARHRILVLLSDGKPTDYDRYEGAYGIADVRQATREAEGEAIRVLALAVDRSAQAHLPKMFGKGRYAILSRAAVLTDALAGLTAGFLR